MNTLEKMITQPDLQIKKLPQPQPREEKKPSGLPDQDLLTNESMQEYIQDDLRYYQELMLLD